MDGFKTGKVRVLVATDILARGLDIDQLPFVVNYELPNVLEDYIHRIGRKGRAGNVGMAVSLVCRDEQKLLRDIEKLLNREIPKEVLEGYEPSPKIKAETMKKGQHNQGCPQQKKKDNDRRRGKFAVNKNPLEGEQELGSERPKKKHNQQKLKQK